MKQFEIWFNDFKNKDKEKNLWIWKGIKVYNKNIINTPLMLAQEVILKNSMDRKIKNKIAEIADKCREVIYKELCEIWTSDRRIK